MLNNVGNSSLVQDVAFMGIVLYVPFLNEGLFTRPIAFPHFMVPALSFHVALILYDEFRKIIIRKGMKKVNGKQKMAGWFA